MPVTNLASAGNIITVYDGSKDQKKYMVSAFRRNKATIRKAKIEMMMTNSEYRPKRTLKRHDGGLEFQGSQDWILSEAEAAEPFADGDVEELDSDDEKEDEWNETVTDEHEDGGIFLGDIKGDFKNRTESATTDFGNIAEAHIESTTTINNSGITKTVSSTTVDDSARSPILSNTQLKELDDIQADFLRKTMDWASGHKLELAGSTQIILTVQQKVKKVEVEAEKSGS